MANSITHFFITAVHTMPQDDLDKYIAERCLRDPDFAEQVARNRKIIGEDYDNNKQSEYYDRSRCWGYLPTFDEAEYAVLVNENDMHECYYQWIVIEEHYMGSWSMHTDNRTWYHWNEQIEKYEKVSNPDWAEGIVGWGIG